MTRDFRIEGPCMAFVRGGAHMSGRAIGAVTELGLSSEAVSIEPRFRHSDIRVDDFGSDVPAEMQWQLSDAIIRMTLVHLDWYALDVCVGESMGGGAINWGVNVNPALNPAFNADLTTNLRSMFAGHIAPAGKLMGNGLPMYFSGNHYITLGLSAPYTGMPWRFISCYLAERPLVYPTGSEYSKVELTWRAIPYAPIFVSGLENNSASVFGPAYSLPPAVDTSVSLVGDDFDPFDPDAVPGQGEFYLTKEILSSGLCLWDRNSLY